MSLFVTLQRWVPQHALSRFVGAVARSELGIFKSPFINLFARAYNVDMSQAARSELSAYRSFNDFFTRELADGVRPLAPEDDAIICPADGAVSQLGKIESGQLIQAKGIRYPFSALTQGIDESEFEGGEFITIYLAPSDYHRVHIPVSGTLTRTVAIPGALYSVNATTESEIPGLFHKNERLVASFDTKHGNVLSIMVGAMIVASIETVWGGPQSPYRSIQDDIHEQAFQRGDEMGRFLLGSTVILCFQKNQAQWRSDLGPGSVVRMGESLGTLIGGV